MYIGYIPYDSSKFTASQWVNDGYSLITEQMIHDGVTNGNITKSDTQAVTADYTGFGDVPKNSLIVIAVPSSSNLVVKQDNGFGAQIEFTVTPVTNGEQKTTVNGESYDLYGQLAGVTYVNDGYFYVNNK